MSSEIFPVSIPLKGSLPPDNILDNISGGNICHFDSTKRIISPPAANQNSTRFVVCPNVVFVVVCPKTQRREQEFLQCSTVFHRRRERLLYILVIVNYPAVEHFCLESFSTEKNSFRTSSFNIVVIVSYPESISG